MQQSSELKSQSSVVLGLKFPISTTPFCLQPFLRQRRSNINNQSTIAQRQLQPIEHVFNGNSGSKSPTELLLAWPHANPIHPPCTKKKTAKEHSFRITFIVCMLICREYWMRPIFSKGTSTRMGSRDARCDLNRPRGADEGEDEGEDESGRKMMSGRSPLCTMVLTSFAERGRFSGLSNSRRSP